MDAYKGKPFAAFSAETGRTRIFTPSVKGDGGWQVTRFDKQGKPSGDTLYPSWDEAVRTEQRYGLKMETAHDPVNTHSWRKPLSEVVDAAQGSRILVGHEIGKLEMAVRREHQAVVEAALREGRPVPPEVLADYPELKGKGEAGNSPVIPNSSRSARLRAKAEEVIRRAEALERRSSTRFDTAPGAAVTGGSGRHRSGLHKKTNQAIEGSLNDLREAKRLREVAGRIRERANREDPAMQAKAAEKKATNEAARAAVAAKESAERAAAPIVNEDRPGAVRMTKAEWAKTNKDYKGVSVRDGVRVRTVVKGGTLSDVFITDAPAKSAAPPKSLLSRTADRLAATADKLKAGADIRKGGKGFKGKGGRAGASDLGKVASYVAVKVAEGAVRTAEKIRVTIADAIKYAKAFGNFTPEQHREIARQAARLIAASRNKDGSISEHKLELARREMRQSESADVREEMAKREATATGKHKLSEQAQKHADEMAAQREVFADAIDTLKAKAAVGQNIRKDLVRLAKDYLEPSDRGKVLDFIHKARAKNTGDGATDWFTGLKKILGAAETSERRRARLALKDTVGNAKKKPGEKPPRSEIDAEMVRKEPTYLIKDRINPKLLAPEYKAAVQPVIDSIQNEQTLSGLDVVAKFIQDQTDAGLSSLFSEEDLGQLRGLNGRSLKDKNLTAEQIHLVDKALQHIAFLDEHAHTARVEGKLRDVRDDATTAASDLTGRVKAITQGWLAAFRGLAAKGERGGLGGSLRDFLGRTQRDLRTLVTVPFGKGSEAYRYLYDEIRKASSRKKAIEIKAANELATVATAHKIKPQQLGKDRKKKAAITDAQGNVLDLTRAEAMHIYAISTDPESVAEIAKAGFRSKRYSLNADKVLRLTPEDIRAIRDQLTDFEKAYIAKFKEVTNGDLRDQGNEVSNALDGYDLFTNTEHVSRKRDRPLTMREDSVAAHAWAENLGITKARSSSTTPLLVDDFYAFADDHIGKMASYIATAEPLRNARLFLSREEVAQEVTKRLGNDWTATVYKRLEAVAGVAPRKTTKFGKLLGWLNRNNARTALWGRISSAAQQIAGIPLAMATMTGAERLHALKLLADPRSYFGGMDKLRELSGYFADRYGSMNERLASGLAGEAMVPTTAFGRIYAKSVEVGFKPLQFMDERSAIFAYKVARSALESSGLKGAELDAAAVDRAEQIIRESQNTTDDVDRSGMAIESADSPLLAAWTMFSSPMNKMRNMVESRVVDVLKAPKDAKAWAELGTSSALVALSLAASAALRELWKQQREGFKDNKRDWRDYVTSAVADVGNGIVPKLGDRIRNLVNVARHKPAFQGDDSPVAGLYSLGEAIVSGIDKATADYSKKEWRTIAEKALRGVGPVFGIPGIGPYDLIRGIERSAE